MILAKSSKCVSNITLSWLDKGIAALVLWVNVGDSRMDLKLEKSVYGFQIAEIYSDIE